MCDRLPEKRPLLRRARASPLQVLTLGCSAAAVSRKPTQPPCSVEMKVTVSPLARVQSTVPSSSQSASFTRHKIPGLLRHPRGRCTHAPWCKTEPPARGPGTTGKSRAPAASETPRANHTMILAPHSRIPSHSVSPSARNSSGRSLSRLFRIHVSSRPTRSSSPGTSSATSNRLTCPNSSSSPPLRTCSSGGEGARKCSPTHCHGCLKPRWTARAHLSSMLIRVVCLSGSVADSDARGAVAAGAGAAAASVGTAVAALSPVEGSAITVQLAIVQANWRLVRRGCTLSGGAWMNAEAEPPTTAHAGPGALSPPEGMGGTGSRPSARRAGASEPELETVTLGVIGESGLALLKRSPGATLPPATARDRSAE